MNSRSFFSKRASRKALVAIPLCLTLGLSACGNDSGGDVASTETSTNTVTSTAQSTIAQTQASALQEMIVGPEDAPEGLEHTDVSTINDLASDLAGNVNFDGPVQPEQCQPLAVDISTVGKWAALPKEESATAMFSVPDSDEVAIVRVDATETTVNPDECGTITREHANEIAKSVSTYSVTPMEIDINDADNVVAVEEKLEGLNVAGQDLDVPPAGSQNVIITGTVKGKTFTVVGSNTIPKEALQALAQNQVNKINEKA
ncbi:hypothetical protein [Corynebacterium gerontici]|uniref:DUF5642 domain-containing protein n=1 Tax=Corynebacterium gerontici TaxID=2079234 RepID=A0A3G6J2F2_9CORY|nr:hypothetical protein [Corynebacterium gerontici]AZA12241.1 hypothetical protein CGERO_09770 [Corynebacterium gerontici]